MGLPGELRNRIYRLCLVSEDHIIVTTTTFPEPRLLKTCKEIREEASTIYYGENQFEAWIHRYDSSPIMAILAKTATFERLGHAPAH